MAKRIIIGNVAGGFDARISRRGFDAEFDDVNDRKKISFAASRPSFARVAETGRLTSSDAWLATQKVYADGTPIPSFVEIIGDSSYAGRQATYTNAQTDTVKTTAFVVVSDNNQLVATAVAKLFQPLPINGSFKYFCVGN